MYFTLAAVIITVLQTGQASEYKRVCFYKGWSGSGAASFGPENIDPSLCSHLIYAYADLENNRITPPVPEYEPHNLPDIYARVNDLKSVNPRLKTLISIGGWNLKPSKFSAMLATSRNRRTFIRSVMQFLEEFRFDGIDLQFQYPGSRGSPTLDRYRFSSLCREMWSQMKIKNRKEGSTYFFVVTGPAEEEFIKRGYDARAISRYAQFINIMTFDLHGAWEDRTGHQAPLFAGKDINAADKTQNLEWVASLWHRLGVPKKKIVIGLALYGRGFTLANPALSGLGSMAAAPSIAGPYTKEGGFLTFYEVCQLLSGGASRRWLIGQQVPYLTLGSQWIGYDDRASLTQKVRWLKQEGYGGWMAWSLEYDDFTGKFCHVGKFPLLNAMNDALNESPSYTEIPPPIEDIRMKPTTQSPSNDDSDILGSFCGNRVDGYYRYPGYCDRYIVCVWEAAIPKVCPQGLTYSAENRKCDMPYGFSDC